ncbi:MAG TPA: GAF domain-containing protein [Blastocatellia bacterium]|nr:GAF domain-containing protein [Blastocatellia bacterium]
MPSGLLQSSSANPLTIIVVIIVLILIIGVVVFLVLRQRAHRQEQDTIARERLLEMERASQFGAAADQVMHSHNPAEVASDVCELFRDHLSMRVMAIYAGRETDTTLIDILGAVTSPEGSASSHREAQLPAFVDAALLQETTRPSVVELALADVSPSSISGTETATSPAPAYDGETTETERQPHGEVQTETAETVATSGATEFGIGVGETVILIPWHGSFGWAGLIAVPSPDGVAPEALDSYHEPLSRLTDKLSVALEFVQSDAALRAFDQRASRTTEFSRSVIACLEEQSPLESIVREVTGLVGSDSAALWRMDETSGMIRMIAAYGLKSSEFLPLPLGQGLAGNVAQSAEAISLEDAPADPRCIFPREARESGIASYLAAPLTVDGKTLGVIEAHTVSRRTWTESDRRALESAAAIITELIKTTESRGDRLRVETAYLGLSEALQRLRSAEEVKEAVVEVLGHALGASRVIVVEFNDEDRPLPVSQEYRQPSVKSAVGATFTEALVAEVQASTDGGQPLAITDSKTRSLMGPETAEELAVLSELISPIRIDGKMRAIIYVHQCDREREWEKEEIDFADRVVRQLSLSLSNLRALEQAYSAAENARASTGGPDAIAGGLPEVVIGLDRDGKLNYFNGAAAEKFGLTNDDLGRTMDGTHAKDAIDKAVWQSVNTCEGVIRLDSKASIASQLEAVPVSIAAAPLRDEDRQITGRVVVITDLSHIASASVAARISELERKLESYERVLTQSRAAEEEARAMLARASALEAKARAEADVTRRGEAEAKRQLELSLASQKQAQGSAQQLLEINRLKSEFIVNAGHEIEASLQSVLGMAELLQGGSYGNLTSEQREAVNGIYGWARRIKGDVDWLIEYGSARSRRLETSGAD